jgi:hypothetical protein
MGHTAGVTGRQGMLTLPNHLISSLTYSEVRVYPFSDFSPTGFMRLITVRYLCHLFKTKSIISETLLVTGICNQFELVWLFTILRPAQEFSLIYGDVKGCKIRPMLGAMSL